MNKAPAWPSTVESIRHAVIGHDAAIHTPFGLRRVTYADWTASGRSLSLIENAIHQAVLPLYANTHSESSGTGIHTTRLREWARTAIRTAVGANSGEHAVIFVGSGATAAIDRLITILGLRHPAAGGSTRETPLVIVGPYEHHSNEVQWRETRAEVVVVPLDEEGQIDTGALETILIHNRRREVIGSFSAASNVTGMLSDVDRVTRILKRHDALACWDYAAAAPYTTIAMHSHESDPLRCQDAVFISPHKFIGGPGTPGILVIRRELAANAVPSIPGGGTVAYVGPGAHDYITDIEHREEGGTPDIIGSIRAGLAFQLKEHIGTDTIRHYEERFTRQALDRWSAHPKIEILGDTSRPRLPIIAFNIRGHTSGRRLHHNYVVALLNDLFGIQSRGGCSCAGPYGHHLLRIDETLSLQYRNRILKGDTVLKPGWVRLSFNYFTSEEEVRYILDAVEMIAHHGWRLLPDYDMEPSTGVWRHRHDVAAAGLTNPESAGEFPTLLPVPTLPVEALQDHLEAARQILGAGSNPRIDQARPQADALTWFETHTLDVDTRWETA